MVASNDSSDLAVDDWHNDHYLWEGYINANEAHLVCNRKTANPILCGLILEGDVVNGNCEHCDKRRIIRIVNIWLM